MGGLWGKCMVPLRSSVVGCSVLNWRPDIILTYIGVHLPNVSFPVKKQRDCNFAPALRQLHKSSSVTVKVRTTHFNGAGDIESPLPG